MKQNKKLKVLWICGFSNHQIRERLPLSKHKSVNFIKSLFNKPTRKPYSDFGAWITNSIKEFEKFDDVELHVVSPHRFMTKISVRLNINSVNYYFYKQDIPFIHLPFPLKSYWGCNPQFLFSRYYVNKIIKEVQPDIVNLIGTEYPPKAITALDIKNIPVYVSMQTVYNNPLRKVYSSSFSKFRSEVEHQIFNKCTYYGCGSRMHHDLVKEYCPNAKIFKLFFPRQWPDRVNIVEKEFDFVYFAGLHKKKGIEDLLGALAIVKKDFPKVRLNVLGGTKGKYVEKLKEEISFLDIKENVVFTDRFSEYKNLFQHLMKSHFAALPVMLDAIPSCVNEAMYLGLPVVTYRTHGMPFLNKDGDVVLMSEIGDIEALADNMIKLMKSPGLASILAQEAKLFVKQEFDNQSNCRKLLKDYNSVINHFKNNNPIPNELLFDTNEFPVY